EFFAGTLEKHYRLLLPKFLSTNRCPLPCRSLFASVFVSPTGEVHPCITDDRIVGRLREQNYSLRKILRSTAAERLRHDIAAGNCPHCWTPCEAYPTLIETMKMSGKP
ncbi:MAG: radical SAM protein, partial [Candidatus Hydrogenedentota bacterium]